jgi:hypothetical protein
MGTRNQGSFLGIKRRKREVNHSPASGVEVKNELNCTSVCFRGGDRKKIMLFISSYLPLTDLKCDYMSLLKLATIKSVPESTVVEKQ